MLKFPKLKELSFLVYGFGQSGRSVIKFFKKNKIKNFKVWDDVYKNVPTNYRPKDLNLTLDKVDYIILTPGVSLIKNKYLRKFKNKIITDIDLFYLKNKKFKSIVVTGTNGKSTTCKLLAHLLKKNKFSYILGGNIGIPILDLKKPLNNYVIIEASSFQLSHSKFICPDYALLLNLTNDHLDWHGSMRNYLNSKLKIFKLQNNKNFAIINPKLKEIFKKKKYLSKLIIPNYKSYKKLKLQIKNDYLKSNINDENMSFVYTFSQLLKINKKSFLKSMRSFKGLPHRFEIFLKKKNIVFINDSKATTFKAAQSALSSLKNIYWILGGIPKKGDKLQFLNSKKNIIKCYLIGKSVNYFKNQLKDKIDYEITKNLKNTILKILKDCKSLNKVNKSILFSPAAASFDQFNNFEHRGDEFKKIIRQYAGKFN